MKIPALLLAVLLAPIAGYAAEPPTPGYTMGREIPLGAPDRWDYVTYDRTTNRVFVSHLSEVTVVDPATGSVVGRIPGLAKSHGIAIVAAEGKGFMTDGSAGTVTAFDLNTLKPLKTLKTAPDADGIIYDPASNLVFDMNGDDESVSVIDPAKELVLKTVKLGGSPEAAKPDGKGHLYINIASTDEIVRLDIATLGVDRRWKIAPGHAPHGLAIDPAAHRLYASCANQIMVALDSEDGHIVATLPIGRGTDDAAFDPVRKLAFSSNGDGTLTVIDAADPDHPVIRETVTTLRGARTMALDPVSGRVFLVTADTDQAPGDTGRFQAKPGTVKLVILAPAG
jgi:YVTN family beta-propeller protein